MAATGQSGIVAVLRVLVATRVAGACVSARDATGSNDDARFASWSGLSSRSRARCSNMGTH